MVTNNSSVDTIAPLFLNAATSIDGTKVILTYSEALSATKAAVSAFVVKVGGLTKTVSSVVVNGSTVELNLAAAVINGQSVTVAYTAPVANPAATNAAIQDVAGNDALSLTAISVINNVLDKTPPIANVTTATINNMGNASVQSTELGTAYLVKDTVTVTNLASITSAADNVWNSVAITAANKATSLSALGLIDGTYKLYAVDASGNLSVAAANRVTIDTVAPTATLSALSFSDDTGISTTDFITKTATQTISGVLSAPTVAGDVVKISLNNGATWQTAINSVGSANFKYTGSLVASNTLLVRVEDKVGNAGPVKSQAYVFDTTAPTTTVSTLNFSADTGDINTDFNTKTAAQTISGTLSAATVGGEIVKISLDNGVTWQIAANTVGDTSFNYTGTLISSNTLQARLEDVAGNAGTAKSLLYVLDSTAPTTTVSTLSFSADTGTSDTDFITKTAEQTVSGTLSAARQTGETVKISLDNGISWQNATCTVGSTSFSYTGTLATSHTLKAWVEDIAGNTGAVKSQMYKLDNIAPTTTVSTLSFSADTGISNTDFITKTAVQTINGTLSVATADGEVVKVSLDNGTTWQTATNTIGSINFSYAATLTASYVLQARVEDAAGNAGAEKIQTYVLDKIAPTNEVSTLSFSADTGDSSTDFNTNNATQTISGSLISSTLVGEVVKISLDNGTTWQTATNTVGTTNFSYATTLSASNTLQVRVEDAAGNAGTARIQAYGLDTSAPTIALSSDKSTLSEGQTATITFTLSEASTSFVMNDMVVTGGVLSNFTGSGSSYTATFTRAANSTINASVSVASAKFSDMVGNLNADGSDTNNTISFNTNHSPTGSVGISGIQKVGNSLTADTSAIADVDGLGAFSYQWCVDGLAIQDQTASTLNLNNALAMYTHLAISGTGSSSDLASDWVAGHSFSVNVSYTDQKGTLEALQSGLTGVIAA